MRIPLSYSFRNLRTRRLTTALTAGGMALVVFVFASILMLAQGLKKTLVETGSAGNAIVLRKGALTEVQSGITREQASVIATYPQVALGSDGNSLLADELVVLITLPKTGGGISNVTVRGIGKESLALRPQVRLVEGRMPRPGSSEIAAGNRVAKIFKGVGPGGTLHFGMRDWKVVGIFDAGSTAFSSEIWGDADQLMQAFRRDAYSSVLFRLRDPSAFDEFERRIGRDPRLGLQAMRENRYYEKQSEMMAKFLRVLGISLTIIFSLGAIIGAVITMYAAVVGRTREIGTLRALGFDRNSILWAFLAESLLLGLFGGAAGLFLASFLQLFTISTINFQTFAELSFSFNLTASIAWQAMAFSLVMGFAGGVFPALRAARMNIVEALRAG
ncbi:MAG: FtsX-like permease family protein [Nitrospiraceae bacterium]|nr:FtsX-like permease family protein [Nitrospiraceae bacterium]